MVSNVGRNLTVCRSPLWMCFLISLLCLFHFRRPPSSFRRSVGSSRRGLPEAGWASPSRVGLGLCLDLHLAQESTKAGADPPRVIGVAPTEPCTQFGVSTSTQRVRGESATMPSEGRTHACSYRRHRSRRDSRGGSPRRGDHVLRPAQLIPPRTHGSLSGVSQRRGRRSRSRARPTGL